MDYLYITSEIRKTVIADVGVFNKIGTRFYPQRVQLDSQPVYPLVGFSLIGGVPDNDNYPTDLSLFEALYASETSLDEAVELYQIIYDILNLATFTNNTTAFSVFEDSKPIEDSGEFGGKFVYLCSNTWRVKSVG